MDEMKAIETTEEFKLLQQVVEGLIARQLRARVLWDDEYEGAKRYVPYEVEVDPTGNGGGALVFWLRTSNKGKPELDAKSSVDLPSGLSIPLAPWLLQALKLDGTTARLETLVSAFNTSVTDRRATWDADEGVMEERLAPKKKGGSNRGKKFIQSFCTSS